MITYIRCTALSRWQQASIIMTVWMVSVHLTLLNTLSGISHLNAVSAECSMTGHVTSSLSGSSEVRGHQHLAGTVQSSPADPWNTSKCHMKTVKLRVTEHLYFSTSVFVRAMTLFPQRCNSLERNFSGMFDMVVFSVCSHLVMRGLSHLQTDEGSIDLWAAGM